MLSQKSRDKNKFYNLLSLVSNLKDEKHCIK